MIDDLVESSLGFLKEIQEKWENEKKKKEQKEKEKIGRSDT